MNSTGTLDQISFGFIQEFEALQKLENLKRRRAQQKEYWKASWNWDGPKVGELLEVGSTCVKRLGDDHLSFWYTAPCIAEQEIEPDVWIARVSYPEDAPQYCIELNGTRLVLDVADIWAPVAHLTSLRGYK